MSEQHTYSIYLLKEGFNLQNSMKDNNGLKQYTGSIHPNNAVMFYKVSTPYDPWWKTFWGASFKEKCNLACALVFYPYKSRMFVFSYGSAYNYLLDNCYEYDFGLKTTLNAIDPVKLRSTDTFVLETAKRERLQAPDFKELTFFDIDSDSTLIKSLTGKTLDKYQDIMTNVTGSNSVRVTNSLASTELDTLLDELLSLYKKTSYKKAFPNIDKIHPEKDPAIIRELENLLIKSIEKKNNDLELSLPEIIDFSEFQAILFTYKRNKSDQIIESDFTKESLFNFCDKILSLENLKISDFIKSIRVNLVKDDKISNTTYPLFKCLLFSVQLNKKYYCLNDGAWYEVDNSFIKKITKFLDAKFNKNPFGNYKESDYSKKDDEGAYNLKQQNLSQRIVCMDKSKLIGSIEPCDILSIKKSKLIFSHIKIGTGSAKLSHLFNQGVNSLLLLKKEPDQKNKLYTEVSDRILNDQDLLKEFQEFINDDKTYEVEFGIITKKNGSKKAANLPIFSRISLYRAFKEFELLNVEHRIYYIERSN